jgi:UDP-N-acetylmuramate dehydrogenase
MLKIAKNVVLAPYTTLKIGPAAEFFAIVRNREDLQEAIVWAQNHKKPIWVLGGGSNVLISKKIKALVLKNEITGMAIIERHRAYALVQAKSGENWTKFVNFTVQHDLYGLENLFLIYGTVGAAPIQNIGAYGVELKDTFYSLQAIDLKTGREKTFSLPDCHFGYRDSIFKHRLKGKYFIYAVTVKLQRRANFKLDYGSLREELLKKGIKKPSLQEVINTIQVVRNSKLPNPALLPNAGSFFKNVEIGQAQFKKLLKKYPEIPHWPAGGTKVKIPAGWLIEVTGFKGKKFGPVGMHERQALVLVNHGQAEPKQVVALVKKIQAQVKRQFGLDLQAEVNII